MPSYGVSAALALFAGLMLAMRTAARLGISPGEVWNFGLIGVGSAVAGSRLVLIAGHWRDFLAYPLPMLSVRIPRTTDTVLTELGLGVFAGLLYLTARRIPWRSTLDAAAPGFALGQAILAVGCLLAGCEYGRPAGAAWGVVYRSPWAELWNGTPLYVRLIPVQLYFSALQLVLCAWLLWRLPRRLHAGELAGAWLFLAGLGGYFLNFLRGDDPLLILGGAVSLDQAIDFGMVLLGALLLLMPSRVRE